MAKKTSYNEKTAEDLNKDLSSFRAIVREHQAKALQGGKNSKTYREARKNVARILTAMNRSTNK